MRAIRRFTDLSGCVFWVDPTTGITKDGSNIISAWADQSGAGLWPSLSIANSVTDGFAGATGPTFNASNASFGGKASIDWLSSPSSNCLATVDLGSGAALPQPYTLLVCVLNTATFDASGHTVFDKLSVFGGGNTGRTQILGPGNTVGNTNDTFLGFSVTDSATPNFNSRQNLIRGSELRASAAVLCCVIDASNKCVVRRNGQCFARGKLNIGTAPLRGFRFGHDFGNSNAGWIGSANACVAYSRGLAEGEQILASRLMGQICGVSV